MQALKTGYSYARPATLSKANVILSKLVYYTTAVVADRSIVCAVEREVRGSIPVWEYVLQGPMSEFETR